MRKPRTTVSAGGNFMFASQAQADFFATTLERNGLTEETAMATFPDEDGEFILDALTRQFRQESHQRKVDQPVTDNQRYLLGLYRQSALRQGRRDMVLAIDRALDNILADMAFMSRVIENLQKSTLVLPDQTAQDLQDEETINQIAAEPEMNLYA